MLLVQLLQAVARPHSKVQAVSSMQDTAVRGRSGTRLHLHDDGFLGDFSLLLSDYKENSRNSKGYGEARA